MELAPANIPLTFEVTYDSPDLNVGMSVYDTTADDPTLIQGPLAMSVCVANTYIGKFTPAAGHTYLIFKGVYTDNTFATLSDDYSQSSESIVSVAGIGGGGGAGGGGFSIIGLVNEVEPIVNC